MKINVGIVGYGNLGKAVERVVLANKDFNLVAIFSRRAVISNFSTKVEPYQNFLLYKGKIDVMLLCGGSLSDLEIQTPEIAKYFDVINTFDTHKKISDEFFKIDKIAKDSGTRAILSCGWDPGLFSAIRALFFAVSNTMPTTFWGKGVSMGHSDAIRRIDDVEDAVEFTIPNEDAVKLAKSDRPLGNICLHKRECFVLAPKSKQKQIEQKIKGIPNYFLGQPTTVNFVDNLKLLKLKSKMSHRGQIFCKFTHVCGSKNRMSFEVKMDSNPNFTASVMTAYIYANFNLSKKGSVGAFTTLDIPISYLFCGKSSGELIKQFV